MNPYILIISLCSIIILSFFFNIISKKTNIPSVLLLIALGIGIKYSMDYYGLIDEDLKLNTILEILGNIGLVMIVLEAALDLKLEKKKAKLILKSFIVAILCLVGSMFGIGYLFIYIFPGTTLYTALIYAIPLSIMSSAIIIPSVNKLNTEKREFMVYESTFSDIIGIMVFYFMIGAQGSVEGTGLFWNISMNILSTIVLSTILSYIMVYLFQHLTMQVKLFLIIAVLLMLFAIGKYFHLSSLLIILTFGLILNNTEVFFRGKLSRFFNKEKVEPILRDFHVLTLESAFLIRTFFFVVFGLSISLASLYDFEVTMNSLAIVGILYFVRLLCLKIFAKKFIFPELFIAPRGLITVLLFFVLIKSDNVNIPDFDTGLLLYPILITSIIMMFALISHRGEKVTDVIIKNIPLLNKDKVESVAQEIKDTNQDDTEKE
ncbi:MAG: sodium:proton exchanger [Crocinitomicaceae bacterium]|nr:sodium:proton exchanger [Crocinitomicaceae bacterium]|tara:strand:- start:32580 stop:33878 length:1299 start_codon:yes stop_codon:yes gene_type:complete